MKRTLLTLLASALLCIPGITVADSDEPTTEGYWEGNGRAMYVDGTQATISFIGALLFQDEKFFMVLLSLKYGLAMPQSRSFKKARSSAAPQRECR